MGLFILWVVSAVFVYRMMMRLIGDDADIDHTV